VLILNSYVHDAFEVFYTFIDIGLNLDSNLIGFVIVCKLMCSCSPPPKKKTTICFAFQILLRYSSFLIEKMQAGATTRKGAVHIDRQNSEISYFADDEDANRKKYSRRGE